MRWRSSTLFRPHARLSDELPPAVPLRPLGGQAERGPVQESTMQRFARYAVPVKGSVDASTGFQRLMLRFLPARSGAASSRRRLRRVRAARSVISALPGEGGIRSAPARRHWAVLVDSLVWLLTSLPAAMWRRLYVSGRPTIVGCGGRPSPQPLARSGVLRTRSGDFVVQLLPGAHSGGRSTRPLRLRAEGHPSARRSLGRNRPVRSV